MISWIRIHALVSIGGAIVILLVGVGIYQTQKPKASTIVTAAVVRANIEQDVSVVGTVDVAERVKLSARRSGPVFAITHTVGDHVHANDGIIQMKSSDEQLSLQQAHAQLQKAQADLLLRLAGESKESLETLSAATAQRAAELQKAHDDLVSATSDQQLTVRTQQQLLLDAQSNLKLAAQSGFTSASTALNDADAILGIDTQTSNEVFRDNLGVKDPGSLSAAKDLYRTTKGLRAEAATSLNAALADTQELGVRRLLDSTSALLSSVSRVLETSVTSDSFPQATLNAKQAIIATDRVTVNASQTSLQSKSQSYHAVQFAQESAVNDAATMVTSKKNAVAVAQAAFEAARAAEQAKRVPPRSVDIAALEALISEMQVQVSQAQQAVEDTIVRAPVDGVISDIPVKIGEVVAANQVVVEVLGAGRLEVKANIPEVDIGKITMGQKATMILDAFGPSEQFKGVVVGIDPAQTVVEGVATYQVTFQFDTEDQRLKPGMTANIDMVTESRSNVLVAPQRAVRTINGTRMAKIRVGSTVMDVPVTTGLMGSDGNVEVLSGLKEGDMVVVGGE